MITSRREFLAAGGALAGSPGALAGAPAGLRIGTVSLRACFEKNRYGRVTEAMAELDALRQRMSQEAGQLQKNIADLASRMEEMPRSGELYVQKFRERGHADYDLKLLQEVLRRKVRERLADLESKVYSDVRRVLPPLARQLNLDFVFRAEEPAHREEDSEGSPAATRFSREVLFHPEAVDVTSQVLDRLNADWANAWTCNACKRKAVEDKCPDCGAARP